MKKNRSAFAWLVLLGTLCACTVRAHASTTNDAAQILQWAQRVEQLALQAAEVAVASIPGARVEVVAGQLDPRLKLAPCDQVDIYLPAGQRAWGATRVGLRCISGAARWNVFMPLTVRILAPAVQTASALPNGTLIAPEHLQVLPADWSAVNSPAFTRPELVVGRTLSRALPAGSTLRESDLKKRQWFAVGDVVKVQAIGNGFRVSSEGVALTPGFAGESARVKAENGRTLTGTVTGERELQVNL